MEEVKILHETAKLAKEKGFNIGNDNSESYNEDGSVTKAGNQNYDEICYRVTQSLLQKWLREEHGIILEVKYLVKPNVWIPLLPLIEDIFFFDGGTYEQALEEGLQEALKLIK